jgi:hypothetical protein
MSEADLTDAIAALMVRVKQRLEHRRNIRLEYLGGQNFAYRRLQ